jgi:site-specific DNA-methyltransferase (adenine-specific)
MDTEYKLLQGDCLDKLKELEDNSIDAVVTDPPYGLSFMGKKWDYDVPSQEIWEECMRVLKPGGHLLAFAGSRTYHRMAVRVEDAGFEIRDQIMWIYGSGFPKSHNIGKAVDKIQGNPREVVGSDSRTAKDACWGKADPNSPNYDGSTYGVGEWDVTKGNSPWEGWGTALKPAHEPIVMARKPIEGSVAQNVLKHGVGGLNIDGCRIEYQNGFENEFSETYLKSGHSKEDDGGDVLNISGGKRNGVYVNAEGRFPANIILDEEAGKILDKQSGVTKSNKRSEKNNKKTEGTLTYTPPQAIYNDNNTHADEGGASRFFYCPKVSKKERNEGMSEDVPVFSGRPRREDGSVIYKETHPEEWAEAMSKRERKDKTALAGAEEKLNSGERIITGRDPGQDARAVPFKLRPIGRHNIHPTVKPTDLMAYLIRLVTPKNGIVLDPFMGSGSTGKACAREGMRFVGIERDEEYMEIATQRVEHEYNKRKFF